MKTIRLFIAAIAFSIALGTGASSLSAETFAEWLARFEVPAGQQGPHDNPIGDGIENVVKYALDLNPMEFARDGLPQARVENDRLTLTIPKNPNAIGVEIIVEASGDLLNWSDEEVEVLDETGTQLEVADTVATTASQRRFLRIVIPPLATGPMPDAYLYIVGGRMRPATEHPNFDKELDLVDTNLFSDTASTAEERQVDVRSVLIADVDFETRTVSNWRRNSTYLPTNHPVDDGVLHWTYLNGAVHHYNGRLYAGPAFYNLTGDELASGIWSPSNFIVWADINLSDGSLGEFSTSEPFPGEDTEAFVRLAATAIVEVDDAAYFYVLGGSPGPSDRILYAPIDPETGALGAWEIATQTLPAGINENAAIGINGRIIHSGGGPPANPRDAYEIVPVESDGNIIAPWNEDSGIRNLGWGQFEHSMNLTEVNGTQFLHLIGGTVDVLFDELDSSGIPKGYPLWAPFQASALVPELRRRASTASYGDLIVLTGGSTNFSYANTLLENNLWIATVGPDGHVTWSGNGGVPVSEGEPLWAPRSFHGSVMVPAGLLED